MTTTKLAKQSVIQSISQSVHQSVRRSDGESVFQSVGYSRNCKVRPVANPHTDLTQLSPESPNERKWTELKVATFPKRAPKLALLMFVKEGAIINNAKMWQSWTNHAKEQGLDFTMHIHAKEDYDKAWQAWTHHTKKQGGSSAAMQDQAKEDHENLILKYKYPRWTPTSWCDMFDAEIMLMRAALQDPEVTHLMTLSANSVPLKNLSSIYEEIRRQPATRMCLDYKHKRFGGQRKHSPRAESWWLMTRSDAMPFIQNQALVRNTFKYTHKLKCSDENVWALALLLRKNKWKEDMQLVDECPMFTDWKGSCKAWANRANDGCKNCVNLRKEPHSEAGPGHPRLYKHVGVKAWQELQDNPFWFGRKFADHAFSEIDDPWPSGKLTKVVSKDPAVGGQKKADVKADKRSSKQQAAPAK
jgi:hypothetical protein